MKDMKLGTKESILTTEVTEDTEVKTESAYLCGAVRIKYTDSMYYLHFLHALHGEVYFSVFLVRSVVKNVFYVTGRAKTGQVWAG